MREKQKCKKTRLLSARRIEHCFVARLTHFNPRIPVDHSGFTHFSNGRISENHSPFARDAEG
jgi:hypothetical protein